MQAGPVLESTISLLDIFQNLPALNIFLEDMSATVMKNVELVTDSTAATRIVSADIQISKLELKQTPDNMDNRNRLIRRATAEVQSKITAAGISRLAPEGILFEAQYDVTIIGWHLVGQIWTYNE